MCIDLIMHKAYLNKSLNHPTSARVWKKKKIKDIRPQRKYIHTPKHNLYLRLHACVCVYVRGRRDAHTCLRTGPLTCLQN